MGIRYMDGDYGSKIVCYHWPIPNTVTSRMKYRQVVLHCIGEKTREVYNNFSFPSVTDSTKFHKVIEKFKAHFAPRKNITYSRFKFITFRQNIRQPFDNHLTKIKKLGNGCNFKNLKDSPLRRAITQEK